MFNIMVAWVAKDYEIFQGVILGHAIGNDMMAFNVSTANIVNGDAAILAGVVVAFPCLAALALPVRAVVRFPSAFPDRAVWSALVLGQPLAVAFMATKSLVQRFFAALVARVRFNGAISQTHACGGAVFAIICHFAARLAGTCQDYAACFAHALHGAKVLVLGGLVAVLAGASHFKALVGAGFRAVFCIRDGNWIAACRARLVPEFRVGLVTLAGSARFMGAFKRAVFSDRWFSAHRAGRVFIGVAAFRGTELLLRPYQRFVTGQTIGRLAVIDAVAFGVAVFLKVWRQELAAGEAMILLKLKSLPAFVVAKPLGITRKGLAALGTTPPFAFMGQLVRLVAFKVAELLTELGEGFAAVEAIESKFSLWHFDTSYRVILEKLGQRSRKTVSSAGSDPALALGTL